VDLPVGVLDADPVGAAVVVAVGLPGAQPDALARRALRHLAPADDPDDLPLGDLGVVLRRLQRLLPVLEFALGGGDLGGRDERVLVPAEVIVLVVVVARVGAHRRGGALVTLRARAILGVAAAQGVERVPDDDPAATAAALAPALRLPDLVLRLTLRRAETGQLVRQLVDHRVRALDDLVLGHRCLHHDTILPGSADDYKTPPMLLTA